ncbi:MAG: ABC transporter permease [Acidobacteria bacterium]|nr:ABC transporter permease [Acidobacteriota bacterium]
MSNLLQDLRYALRMLKKNPGFTTVAVLTLALGIGANTAAFSIVDAVMFRPLPVVRAPQELAYVSSSWSYPLFESVRKENSVFDGMFALGGGHAVGLTISDQPEIAHAELVSADYFSVLGIRPAVGRVFLSEEDRAPGTHPVIVLSHRFWKSRFGGDPGVVDKKIRVNGRPYGHGSRPRA